MINIFTKNNVKLIGLLVSVFIAVSIVVAGLYYFVCNITDTTTTGSDIANIFVASATLLGPIILVFTLNAWKEQYNVNLAKDAADNCLRDINKLIVSLAFLKSYISNMEGQDDLNIENIEFESLNIVVNELKDNGYLYNTKWKYIFSKDNRINNLVSEITGLNGIINTAFTLGSELKDLVMGYKNIIQQLKILENSPQATQNFNAAQIESLMQYKARYEAVPVVSQLVYFESKKDEFYAAINRVMDELGRISTNLEKFKEV